MPFRMISHSFDGPEALVLEEFESVEPDLGNVTIDVKAAGTNPADAKSLSGMFGRSEKNLPLLPGSEVSGVVTAIGPDVDHIAVGDEVLAYRVSGGFSTEVMTSESNVFLKPAALSFEEASGLLLAGATAWHLLAAVPIAAGDAVIVHAASGAVGRMVVQLAALRGARVIGTASPANHETVAALGAEPVAYGPGLAERLRDLLPGGASAAYDTVGTDEAIDASVELVSDPTRIATIAAYQRAAEIGAKALGAGPGADPGAEIRGAARAELIALAAEGKLTVEVSRVFQLERAAEALAFLKDGHPGGKVILVP